MIWLAYAQLRDRVVNLGSARTPGKAMALARRRARRLNGANYCLCCRRADVAAPDVELADEIARAFAGFAPSEDVRRQLNAMFVSGALGARRKISIKQRMSDDEQGAEVHAREGR